MIGLSLWGVDSPRSLATPVIEQPIPICEHGGSGLVLEDRLMGYVEGSHPQILPLFGDSEQDWPNGLRVVLYFLGLCWCFVGVAIISDFFMGAIEKITSKKKRGRFSRARHRLPYHLSLSSPYNPRRDQVGDCTSMERHCGESHFDGTWLERPRDIALYHRAIQSRYVLGTLGAQ